MPTAETFSVFSQFVALLRDNPVATMLALALVVVVYLFRANDDSKKEQIAAGLLREAGLQTKLDTANERMQEMGERLAVMSAEFLRTTPDLKWFRRWASAQIKQEEDRLAPAPKSRKLEATNP